MSSSSSSYVEALIGGSLIGISAGMLLLFNGTILGVSGITTSIVLKPIQTIQDPKQYWKLIFLSMFFLSAPIIANTYNELMASKEEAVATTTTLPPQVVLSTIGYIISGLLVGLGTKLSNGCTSGHGICGLGRFSIRSFVVIAMMILVGSATTTTLIQLQQASSSPWSYKNVLDQLYDLDSSGNSPPPPPSSSSKHTFSPLLWPLIIVTAVTTMNPIVVKKSTSTTSSSLISGIAGVVFASGLYISGMSNPLKMVGFLTLNDVFSSWDPTMVFVMMGGILFSAMSYQLIDGYQLKVLFPSSSSLQAPLCYSSPSSSSTPSTSSSSSSSSVSFMKLIPQNTNIDTKLITGSILFGLGIGVGGMCPGSALYNTAAPTSSSSSLLSVLEIDPISKYWWPSFFVGSYIATAMAATMMSKKSKKE